MRPITGYKMMSMRDDSQRPERGLELLLEQLQALEAQPPLRRRRPPFERLSRMLGSDLAGMLVQALSGRHAVSQGMRRRDLVA